MYTLSCFVFVCLPLDLLGPMHSHLPATLLPPPDAPRLCRLHTSGLRYTCLPPLPAHCLSTHRALHLALHVATGHYTTTSLLYLSFLRSHHHTSRWDTGLGAAACCTLTAWIPLPFAPGPTRITPLYRFHSAAAPATSPWASSISLSFLPVLSWILYYRLWSCISLPPLPEHSFSAVIFHLGGTDCALRSGRRSYDFLKRRLPTDVYGLPRTWFAASRHKTDSALVLDRSLEWNCSLRFFCSPHALRFYVRWFSSTAASTTPRTSEFRFLPRNTPAPPASHTHCLPPLPAAIHRDLAGWYHGTPSFYCWNHLLALYSCHTLSPHSPACLPPHHCPLHLGTPRSGWNVCTAPPPLCLAHRLTRFYLLPATRHHCPPRALV